MLGSDPICTLNSGVCGLETGVVGMGLTFPGVLWDGASGADGAPVRLLEHLGAGLLLRARPV